MIHKEAIQSAAERLGEVAIESDAAIAKVIFRDERENPIGMLVYVEGPDTDLFDRAISVVEDSLERAEANA